MIRPGSTENFFRTLTTLAGDFGVAWLALLNATWIRRDVPLPFTRALLPPWKFSAGAPMVALFGVAFLAALALSGFYRRRIMSRARPLLLVALPIQIAFVAIGATILERPLPRTILVLVPLLEVLLLRAWRALHTLVWPLRARDTILVGDAHDIVAAIGVLEAASDRRIRVAGYAGANRAGVGAPWLGPLYDRDVSAAIRDAEEVICVGSDISPRGRLELLRIRGPRGYLLLASHADALLMSSMLGWMGDEPLIEIGVSCGVGVRAVVKRTVDLIGGSVLALIALPAALIVAAAIWFEDRQPILLRQQRLGLGSIPFGMWKFRSMRDGRNTRTGNLLRRYRLDELPQLLNVITGDMSLVGPRPERPEIAEKILDEVPDFDLRCLVRPGIAGLAQTLGEYDSRPAVKLRYDLAYMCSWSLWLDVRLLFASVAAALSGSGV